LFPPVRRPQRVVRRRLAERLNPALGAGNRLTLVSAPAGFGKTTVISEWLIDVEQLGKGTRVGWLSLDDGDNDLSRLVSHLAAALSMLDLELDLAAFEHIDPRSTSDTLTVLVNNVTRAGEAAQGRQWILVLDDYHAITAADVHDAVGFLLEHLPDCLHLVIATRADPPLPLARLRSRGQLTEVRAADLRFTVPEAQDFLTRTMGLTLTSADVEALGVRTEGWIAGLQLAALSLQGIAERAEVTNFIEAFSGSNRFVIDYLADEVLARQPGSVRQFLLCTAVLDRLSGSLCDAVTGRTDGSRLLEELERGNLFLVPLDDQRSWYRYHHLFADVLHARLLAEQPQRVRALHQRASDWFDSQGMAPDAVRHALAGGDHARAAYLMEAALPQLRRTRQDGLQLSWVRSLPESVLRRSPVLGVMSAWSLMMSGDLDAVQSRLDDAEAALAAGEHDPSLAATWAVTEDLRTAPATISVFRASLAQARGDVAGTERHARRALELAGPDDHFLRGAGGGYLGLAAWAAGDVEQALSTFGAAVHSLHAAGNLVDELDGTVVLADLWLAAGRPSRARRLYEQAVQTATGGGEPYPRATSDLHVGLAELDRERDDLVSCQAHLETAQLLGKRASITENRHRWFVAMAQLRAAAGEYETATRFLDEAQSRYRHGFYPDVRPVAAMRARVHIAAGNLESAAEWAHNRGVRADDGAYYLREYEHLTLARLLIAQHRAHHTKTSPVAEALRLLKRLLAAATSARRDGSLLEIRVVQALAHHANGDQPQALGALSRALGYAPEPESYLRLYLDEGAPMVSLLRDAASAGDSRSARAGEPVHGEHVQTLRRQARRILERIRLPGDATLPQPLAQALSQRELDVLRLLDGDLTGPQIARELYISLNTLRTHTKRVFTKLDATNRAGAVHRARERGLL
jgi:LuxR family maltose regulon positive regulatory protein